MGCGVQQQQTETTMIKAEVKPVKVEEKEVPTTKTTTHTTEQVDAQKDVTKSADKTAGTKKKESSPVKKASDKPKEKTAVKAVKVYPDGMAHNKFFQTKTFKMVGGYFVKPKIGNQLQKTQIMIHAPSNTPVKLALSGPNKVGMIACAKSKIFPLEIISDIIQSTQISDKKVEMTIDTPNPNGFVLYVISEGDQCEVTVNAGTYMILDAIHGDLSYIPPELQKIGDKKKRSADLVMREKMWLNQYSMTMHGGEIVGQTKDDDLDDTQFIVHAPTGNHVKISVSGQGKMGLMALGNEESFPIATVSDNVLGYEVGTNLVELEVQSPGPEGFVVMVMSNFIEVKVHIDGMGKIIPCISHSDDHAIEHRSSGSHSTKSSIYKHEEFRAEVIKSNYISTFERTIKGANDIDCEPGIDLEDASQILVYATTGTQIKCEVEGNGNVGIIVMERDSFPLIRSTKIVSSALKQQNKVALTTTCPGIRGLVCYFMGDGQLKVKISSGIRTMVQIVHPK